MVLKTYIPGFQLRKYVASLTYYEGYNPDYTIEKLLPDGTVNIVIELDGIIRYTYDKENFTQQTKCIRAWISGMQREYIAISAEKNSRMLIIQFKPGGSFPFLHIPLAKLNDLIIDADGLLGPGVLELRERLLESKEEETMFLLTENWLLSRARHAALPEAIVHYGATRIMTAPTRASLRQIADHSGYSHKQFIQIFKKHLGLTPKFFQRIIRFNKVLREIENQQRINWTQLSYDCGFYDQAHFINDFKLFSGMNPTDYLGQKGEYLNYIPVYGQ